jgi:hypothetical protein
MEQDPFSEADSRSVDQEILRIYESRTFITDFITARHLTVS